MTPIVIRVSGVALLSTKGAGANSRDHRWAKASATKLHREGANVHVAKAFAALPGYHLVRRMSNGAMVWTAVRQSRHRVEEGATMPVRWITLTRVCPRRHFCDRAGNLSGLFKATQDGVASAIGVDDELFVPLPKGAAVPDGHIGITYEQVDGPWGVVITIEPA